MGPMIHHDLAQRELLTRVVAGQAAYHLLDALLERCRDRQWLQGRGRQRTDAMPVLGAIRGRNRMVWVAATRRHALNRVAVGAPEWWRAHRQPVWLARDGPRREDARLPKGEAPRRAYAHAVGVDGYVWLDAIEAADAPGWWREGPAVETWRRVWSQPYDRAAAGVRWRTSAEGFPSAARMMSAPDDVDAPDAKQDPTSWVGYQGHYTESCEADQPHLMTHVETSAAPVADAAVTSVIHEQ